MASAPPKAGGGDCDRLAQHVHVSVALRQHPPGRLGGDHDGLWRQRAGLLDARPEFSRGAEFCHGQDLVGVCRQSEIDRVARGGERHAMRFERAQIGDGARQREGELLRLRAAGIVDDAAIGDRERAAETVACKTADHVGEGRARGRATAGDFCPMRQSRRSD